MSPAPATPASARSGSAKNAALIAAGCASAIACFYLLARLGPDSSRTPKLDAAATHELMTKLENDSAAAEKAWTETYDRLRAAKAEPTAADLRLLDTYYQARLELENRTSVAKERIPALRKLHHSLHAKSLRKESLELEKKALARESANDSAGAETFYRQAYAVEKDLESRYPEADCKNLSRAVMLESRARVLQAKPIWEKSKAAEALGDSRYAAGDLPAATAAYEDAWQTHTLLDRDFRGITPADLRRTKTLARKRADALADALRAKTEELTLRAEALAASGAFAEIPETRDAALQTLRTIAEQYPESRYAAPDWTDPIRKRLLSAITTRDNRQIEASLAETEAALRARDFPKAIALTESLAREIARVRAQFPGCDRPAPESLERANYLLSIRSELGLIHEVVTPRLRPAPNSPTLLVWETETTQALYDLVIHGDNPSAVRGDNRPVDSITLPEARAFCRKLGWILGRPVRLPAEAEFRAFAADTAALPKDRLALVARAIDNGDGSALPAGRLAAAPSGLKDLLGNVAEWLDSPADRVAGGDAESTLEQLAALPVREQPATRRSRFTGFRFVVEPTPAS